MTNAHLVSTIPFFRDMLVGEKCHSRNTVSAYTGDVRMFLEWLGARPFSSEHFFLYLSSVNYSKVTLSRKTVSISTWVNFCITDLGIDLEFKKPKIKAQNSTPSILSNNDLEALLAYLRQAEDAFRLKMRAIVELLYSSGMRISELVHVTLDQAHELISTTQLEIIGKGNKERIVFVSKTAIEAIENYIAHAKPSAYLFETRLGNPMNRQSIHRQLKIVATRAGVCQDRIFPHSFRHRLASNLNQNGMNLAEIKELFGHSKIKTTLLYTHLDNQWMADLLREKHPLGEV